MSYVSSPYEVIPLIRSNTTDDSKQSAKPFLAANQSSPSSNSFSIQSSPSPDSVYSSHSSDGSSIVSYGNYSRPTCLKNPTRDLKDSPNFTSYEEFSDLQQSTPEERHFSWKRLPSHIETSALDEVLAICEEYEHQIAREIQEKHSNGHRIQAMANEEPHKSMDANAKTPVGSGTNALEESESRTLVLQEQTGSLASDIKRNAEARVQFFQNPMMPTTHHSLSETSQPKVRTVQNGNSFDLGMLRLNQGNYAYENVCVNDLEKQTACITSSQSPTLSSDVVDGPRLKTLALNQPQNGNLVKISKPSPDNPPPKSKLSVSFGSVEEYNMDDYIPRVSSASSSPKSNTELTSRLKVPLNPNSSIVKTVATKVEIHSESQNGSESPSRWDIKSSSSASATASSPIPVIQEACQVVETVPTVDVIQFAEVAQVQPDSTAGPCKIEEDPISRLKSQIRDLEQQEMEALREMEMEKALLLGEEQAMDTQLQTSRAQLEEIRNCLCQIDGGIRLWKVASAQELSAMKRKLSACERNLQRLEKMHEDFCGTTDEETMLLEKLKYQHELVEVERKVYEDAEFQQMEETASKEAQRDDLTKLFTETKRKLSIKQIELEQLRNQNRASLASSVKEIHKLESQRQSLVADLQECQQSVKADTLTIPDNSFFSSNSDSDEMGKNCDLEEKLKALTLLSVATDDAMTIEMIKSNSPIDPKLGVFGAKASETLREIEKYREFLLNEQGVQMLEDERQRVRELQKRVQTAVREEWEAARQNRTNQCNSVGSEESSQTISDTPTESGSSDDGPDKGSLSFGKTEEDGLKGNSNSSEQTTAAFELCQQMRQRQKDLSQSSSDDTPRPLSDSSFYDNRTSIVTLRDKHSLQNNRPLTRYLPVRGDEDHFDLRGHIESSGHQLSLCPQLILTSTVAKGSLLKLGSRFHNWNKRWFVFDRETRTFSYYIDKTQKKPRGGIHFQAIQEVYVDHLQSVKSPAPKLTFCVKTYNRVFHLVAPSPEAMRIWVDVIFTGAEGYEEFKSSA